MSDKQLRVQLHQDYDNAIWRATLEQIDELLRGDATQSLHDGRNSITRMSLNGVEVAVKYFRNQTWQKKLAYKYRSSKARRSFEHTQRLLEAGLRSPQAIAWREDWQGSWLQESYYVCRYHEVAYTAWDLKTDSLPHNKHWLAALGTQIAQMHERGIHHQDLTPGNALFVRDAKGSSSTAASTEGVTAENVADDLVIYFIDNNRMSFGPVSKGLGLRALVSMGFEGEHIAPYASAYAAARGYDVEAACASYRQLLARHHFKWRIKNKTRPWRRKFGF